MEKTVYVIRTETIEECLSWDSAAFPYSADDIIDIYDRRTGHDTCPVAEFSDLASAKKEFHKECMSAVSSISRGSFDALLQADIVMLWEETWEDDDYIEGDLLETYATPLPTKSYELEIDYDDAEEMDSDDIVRSFSGREFLEKEIWTVGGYFRHMKRKDGTKYVIYVRPHLAKRGGKN